MSNTTSTKIWRAFFYVIGAVCLAAGLTLNTKTGLGTAPIISTPLTIATITGWSFARCVFILYSILTAIQFLIKRKWSILLQIPFSVCFSSLLNLFSKWLDFHFDTFLQNLLLLAMAIVVTAVGVSMMVNMKLIANPADGFANTVGELLGRGMGFGKNVVDLSFVVLTLVISLPILHNAFAIGIGTLISMIGVGRIIAVFNHFFKKKMCRMAGFTE